MGCNCLYSFDSTANLEMFVEEPGDKIFLVMNLDPISILRNGTPPENIDVLLETLDEYRTY